MKTIQGCSSQGCTILVILLLLPIVTFCQQKITIKDKDGTAMGHFIVETFYLTNGNEVGLNGNIPTADSKLPINQFRLKIGNLLWFDPNINDVLSINSKNINVSDVDNVRIDLSGEILKLNSGSGKPIVVNLSTQNFGDYKLDIPFETPSYKGRFLQPLSVYNSSTIKSKDIRLIWKSVDNTNPDEIKDFIDEYEKLPVAKKYIKSAQRELKKILIKQREDELKASAKTEVAAEEEEDGLRHIENLETDVRKVVKNVISDENGVVVQNKLSMVIEYEDDLKAVNVTDNDLPLRIQFLNEGEGIDDMDNMISGIDFEGKKDLSYVIDKSLLDEYDLRGDFVNLIVVNSHDKILIEQPLNNLKKKAKSYNSLIVIGLLGLLSGIGFWVYKKRKDQKDQQKQNKKKLANKIKQHQQSVENQHVPGQSANMSVSADLDKPAAKIVIGGKKATAKTPNPTPKKPKNSIGKGANSKIKIVSHKIQSNSMTEEQFKKLVTASEFTKVVLTDIWKDSAISNVYIKKIFGQELQVFLAESSTSGIMNELQGAVPEVGGFLMGRYFDDSNDIKLFVEKFVPFVPEYNDVFKIEIGTKTVVDELGDAQDRYPELDVIGWFHTHPGHGLFLSVSDLSVQRHFPKQFQVAMEIDSLTKRLDMSMFSRKKNGQINNTQSRKEGTEWFSWVEIEKELDL